MTPPSDLRFFVFTNDEAIATAATDAGVSRIVVDLEIHGKEARQKGRSTVISRHTAADISRLRPLIPSGHLVVRVNPLWPGSHDEISDAIARGADSVMLPMWESADELRRFVDMLDGRARAIPLLETRRAAEAIHEAVRVPGIAELHIGLTDLHLQLGMAFLFEVLSDGYLEGLAEACRAADVAFGFGGIGRIGRDAVPPEWVIGEHERLGSSGVILSRSFLADGIRGFDAEVARIRETFAAARHRTATDRHEDQLRTRSRIQEVATTLRARAAGATP